MNKILRPIKYFVQRFYSLHPGFAAVHGEIDNAKILAAQLLIRNMQGDGIYDDLNSAEFKVFSQFGDDGIIQYLIDKIEISNQTFIEFGVGNYCESNTRFLLLNNNWRGLIIDGDHYNIKFIRRDKIYWLHDLTAVCAFITCDNINEIFQSNNCFGEIGLLSIDIDGNDYWTWKSISVVNPVIVIVEYNSIFGESHAVTIPYDPNFYRFKAHPSGLYWGASLKAFSLLAEDKGYAFVGCNSDGNNAYFVRKDKVGSLKIHSLESGFRSAKWSDSRDASGRLSHLKGKRKLEAISEMTVVELVSGQNVRLKDLKLC